MAAIAGLGVLLETKTGQQKQQLLRPAAAAPARTPAAQIISKATLNATTTAARNDVNDTSSSSASFSCSSSASRAAVALPPATAKCSFLQRCFLCHRELADGKDIYIYRGDRAFCSEECRCRHILVEDDDCARVAEADHSRRRRRRQAVAGSFAFELAGREEERTPIS